MRLRDLEPINFTELDSSLTAIRCLTHVTSSTERPSLPFGACSLGDRAVDLLSKVKLSSSRIMKDFDKVSPHPEPSRFRLRRRVADWFASRIQIIPIIPALR